MVRATSCSGSPARRSELPTSTRAPARAARPRRTARALSAPEPAPRCRTSTAATRSCSSASTRCTRCRSSTSACERRCGARTPRGCPRAPNGARRRRRGDRALPRRCGHVRQARGRAWQRSRPGAARPRGIRGNQRAAGALRPGSTMVIYGERVGRGPDGDAALRHLLACADALRLSDDGAGLLEVPETTNARGLREVGCSPSAGPGLWRSPRAGTPRRSSAAYRGRDRRAHPLGRRPASRAARPGRLDGWRSPPPTSSARSGCSATPSAATRTSSCRPRPMREGGHGDSPGRPPPASPSERPAPGRDALRLAVARRARRAPRPRDRDRLGRSALAAIAADVQFYAGLTHEEIGGTGVRWQEREAARALAAQGDRQMCPQDQLPPPRPRPARTGH